MGLSERLALIKKIEELRDSKVICYLTTLRPNVVGSIADDAVRVIFDHLLLMPVRPVGKLDLFLCSNGGAGTVPWRLVPLFREFSESFNVLIPFRAYSAATLLALGADEIVAHPFAELGPIDPTVQNEFNPLSDDQSGRRLGIGVEDVRAYVSFIKSTVGITHEDELIKAIEILANKVHPLALGNVERFVLQSRMIATKILKTHMGSADEHVIKEIVETMASKLFFHGHPINRKEAKDDLKLKVKLDLQPELETAMWDLYKEYETEFKTTESFNPPGDLGKIALERQQERRDSERQMTEAVKLWVDTQPLEQRGVLTLQTGQQLLQYFQLRQQQEDPPKVDYEIMHATIESARLSSRFTSTRSFLYVSVPNGQVAIQEHILDQGWHHETVPTGGVESPTPLTSAEGAP
jgi:serine dehydrogenase proteinase